MWEELRELLEAVWVIRDRNFFVYTDDEEYSYLIIWISHHDWWVVLTRMDKTFEMESMEDEYYSSAEWIVREYWWTILDINQLY